MLEVTLKKGGCRSFYKSRQQGFGVGFQVFGIRFIGYIMVQRFIFNFLWGVEVCFFREVGKYYFIITFMEEFRINREIIYMKFFFFDDDQFFNFFISRC